MPAQRMHRKAPVLMDAQVGRAAAPPPVQSAHARLAGSASSFCSAATCRLFSSMVTPFVSPAALPHARCRSQYQGTISKTDSLSRQQLLQRRKLPLVVLYG